MKCGIWEVYQNLMTCNRTTNTTFRASRFLIL